MFAEWLRSLRRARDLTQEELAEQVGCAVHTLRALESGRRRPSREMAQRLATILAVPPGELNRFLALARGTAAAAPDAPPPPAAAPPAAGPPPPPVSLPAQITPLIGREPELATISAQLRDPACRLLTILGPGGIGKTRLALQVITNLAAEQRFLDGAVWVDLAPVADAGTIATTIATAVGLQLAGARPPEAQLIAHLRGRAMLLALDNFEHLREARSLIEQIVQHAPGMRLLVTSRERLHLSAEWIYEIAGLPAAAGGETNEPAALLFLARARQVDHRFALTPEQAPLVHAICRRLEGMPLGIELAAAWVRILPLAEILAEIERSLDFLAAHGPQADARHRSLRAVFDQSWQRLAPEEQRLLARLTVFRGGATREAVAQVVGAGSTAAPAALLHALAALADKSLLQRGVDATGATRYALHELVRQYAADRLADDPEDEEATRARHAAYYAGWAAAQNERIRSADQYACIEAFEREIDQIRAAWAWVIARRDLGLAQQLQHPLIWMYELRNWYAEAAATFARATAAFRPLAEADGAPLIARQVYWHAVYGEGWFILRREPERAFQLIHRSVEALRTAGPPRILCEGLSSIAYIIGFTGDYTTAERYMDECLQLSRAHGLAWNESIAGWLSGKLLLLRGESAQAHRQLASGRSLASAVGDTRVVSHFLIDLSIAELEIGDVAAADRICRACAELLTTSPDRFQLILLRLAQGRIARAHGDLPEAARLLERALEIARAIGDDWQQTEALSYLGLIAADQGERGRALDLLTEAVRVSRSAPPAVALDVLFAYVQVARQQAEAEAIVAVLAYLCGHPLTRPATRAEAAQLLAALAPQLSPERAQAAYAQAAAAAGEHPAALLRHQPIIAGAAP